MSGVEYLVSTLAAIKKRLEFIPSFTWGSVVSVEPLKVRLDGQDASLDASAAFGSLPTQGARALCVIAGNRLYAFPKSAPAPQPLPPDPNTLWINGTAYPASGTLNVQVGSWAYRWPNAAGQTLQVPFPCDLPLGWTFQTFPLDTYGFTEVHTGNIRRDLKRLYVRVVQAGSHDVNALSKIGWRLVKE